MTERPFPPTPEPAMRGIARAEFGPTILPMCKTRDPDYAQFSLNQMRDFCRADRAAQADYAAVLRELVEAWDGSWESQAIHEKFFAAVRAARELLAKENPV